MNPEARLLELNLQLPPAPQPVAVYQTLVVWQNLAYVSGHGPLQADGSFVVGTVGIDLDLAAAKDAARQTGLAILSTLRAHIGSLDKVERVIKIFGMVHCTPAFKEH